MDSKLKPRLCCEYAAWPESVESSVRSSVRAQSISQATNPRSTRPSMRPVRTTSLLLTPPRPLKWLIALSLFSLLIIALWLLVTLIQTKWLPQYPNSVRLPSCGHSGVAAGAPSPARDTDTFYLYTQTCLVTNDTITQVNAWYNQHRGWKNLAGISGTYRLAIVNLG